MKQHAQQIRTKLFIVIMAGLAGVGLATAATAAQVAAGADAQVAAPDHVQAGGSADAPMSTSGSANSNAQRQSGATRGADRAAERTGTNVIGLEQSTAAGLESAGKATAKAKRQGTR